MNQDVGKECRCHCYCSCGSCCCCCCCYCCCWSAGVAVAAAVAAAFGFAIAILVAHFQVATVNDGNSSKQNKTICERPGKSEARTRTETRIKTNATNKRKKPNIKKKRKNDNNSLLLRQQHQQLMQQHPQQLKQPHLYTQYQERLLMMLSLTTLRVCSQAHTRKRNCERTLTRLLLWRIVMPATRHIVYNCLTQFSFLRA